jgi:hypothetical protein
MSSYGYSRYDTGYFWQGKSGPTASQNLYGLTLYSQLNVNPFVATSRDYGTIILTWSQPQGTYFRFRLVANRYGFPVDENDGDLLIDSATFPGTSYADLNVIPGTYHYYGIYLQISNTPPGIWERAAFASCLAPSPNAMGQRLYDLLPTYFRELQDAELTTDAAGNGYLVQYLNALGWGMDYLKTQYDVLFQHLNDPLFIPLGDLVNLAGQLGMPFQPEVPAQVMRKALANWTHVCQERGTPGGLGGHITLLTGYPVDLQSGPNKMLENDQSMPLHPVPAAWNAGIGYVLNELVTFGSFIYKCILAGGLGHAPTGTTAANTWWQVVQNVTDPGSALANPATVGGINTWQALYPGLDAGGGFATPAGSLVGTVGLPDPLATSNWTHNAFSVFNKAGTTQDIMLRSVSQVASDRTGSNTAMAPDQLQAVKDGIPVPRFNTTTHGWLPTVRYATNNIVLYNGVLYQAQRASTNALPPSPGTPVNANPYFTTTVSPWTPANSATIAQSVTQAFQGVNSMKVTPDGTHANPGASSETINVTPNAVYDFIAWAFIPAGWSTTQTSVVWLDAFGATISTTTSTVTNVAANTWTKILISPAQAPASAATAQLVISLNGTPSAATVSYWDALVLSCGQTPEWTVLSRDNRLRMMMSGYGAQSLTTAGNQTVQMVPFVEWYDEGGNPITSNGQARVTARTAVAGTPGGAPNLSFDSFTLGSGTFLDGRLTDSKDQSWTTQTGAWSVSGFNGGSVFPAVAGTRSIATLTGLATGVWAGVTFGSTVPAGTDAGIVFRLSTTSNYWRAGVSGLYKVTGGVAALMGTYAACLPGDRLVVQLNGNVITVYRNGAQVLSVTDSYNSTATLHGIAVEATSI